MNELNGRNFKTHYGNSMSPGYMGKWGRKMAAKVTALIKDGKYPILIYRGMSGVATATAIAVNIKQCHCEDFGMIYVRKTREKSHGGKIERSELVADNREIVWIFCDDFICSGKTVVEVIKAICVRFSIEINVKHLLFALSLNEDLKNIANELNSLEYAANFHNENEAAVKYVRNAYARFITKRRKELKDTMNRREQFIKEFIQSLTPQLN